jgi:D-sedoheptulose 7-phosphate isomerase
MIDPAAVAAHLEGLAEVARATARALAHEIAATADLVERTLEAGNTLMFCGNGGSAADAQHLATEYVVRFRRDRKALSAIALTTDTSLLTAVSNDFGFDHVFARQVYAIGRPGDLLFLHSTSGETRNLIEAAKAAREVSVHTVALLARGGGALRHYVDRSLIVPTDIGAHAQELHLAIGHAICDLVDARVHAAEQE